MLIHPCLAIGTFILHWIVLNYTTIIAHVSPVIMEEFSLAIELHAKDFHSSNRYFHHCLFFEDVQQVKNPTTDTPCEYRYCLCVIHRFTYSIFPSS